LAALCLLTGCGTSSKDPSSAAPTPPPQPAVYDAKAFFTTTSYGLAGGFAWSADDQQLLMHSDESGIFNAYALTTTGTKQPLTSSTKDSTYAVSWFPADGRILFSANQGGNELDHLFVRELDGTTRDLTPGEKTKAQFLGWSQDRSHLFVGTNERDARSFDVYRYAVQGYQRELLFRNDESLGIAEVAPDGSYVALTKPRNSADSDVYLFDSRKPKVKPKLITAHQGNVSHSVFAFTRDSKQLVYSTDQHGEFTQAWTYDLADGKQAPLIAASWDVAFVDYSESGRYRISATNNDARTAITILDNSTGKELQVPGVPAGDLSQLRFSRDEKRLALMVSSDTSPNDVYVVDLGSGAGQRLTQALNPQIKESDLVATQVVRYKSFDGLEIPSILYKPKSAAASAKVPALVWVHGGPGGQSRTGYSAMIQHLVNHGYAVLAANNRGSSGYGKTFFHMDDKRHGDVDLKDIVAGKDYLAAQDWVDGKRIGIIGGSYGGYMVGAALAFQPDAFAVGVDIFGVMNWVRTLESIPPWWQSSKPSLYDEMGDPATDAERHRRISPLFHTKNIKVPLLVVQGANDPRVLQVESDEIVQKVRDNGVPVEYVLFPDEGHGFTKRENRIKASDAFVSFLDKHLKQAGAPPAA
jgi:dipeptidyl aminopeptidase/acylaminoacyl peptidase